MNKKKQNQGRRVEIQRTRQTNEKMCNEATEHWITIHCEEIEANIEVNSKIVH